MPLPPSTRARCPARALWRLEGQHDRGRGLAGRRVDGSDFQGVPQGGEILADRLELRVGAGALEAAHRKLPQAGQAGDGGLTQATVS